MDSRCEWYAVFVATGNEERVKKCINQRFFDLLKAYVPKRILKERKKGVWTIKSAVLFPGYVFINGYIGEERYNELKSIPGIWNILCYGNEILPIPEQEMEVVLRLISQGENIKQSYLLKGTQIVVTDGPLKGMEGNIRRIDHRKGRADVAFTFLGEERVIKLSVEFVEESFNNL